MDIPVPVHERPLQQDAQARIPYAQSLTREQLEHVLGCPDGLRAFDRDYPEGRIAVPATVPELLARLQQCRVARRYVGWAVQAGAVPAWSLRGVDLRQATLIGAGFHGLDLREADLSGAGLRRADLHGADLRGADVRGADLRGANLRWADLRGADLRGADLRGAALDWATLRGADVREANLRGATLDAADLQGADVRGAVLD